jgi:gliding motility-associated-like protein
MPSAFTPNQDGLNDEFRFKIPAAVTNFSMQAYNRLGQLLFTTSNAGKGWDGTWHGVKQATGTYVWKMQYENTNGEANNFKGTILLIR